MKTKTIFITVAALGFAASVVSYDWCPKKGNDYVEVNIGATKLKAEIADEQSEFTRGLMFREQLEENEGMIFVFHEEKERKFWMKNTVIPLDMLFIDKHKKIVHIVENARPCRKEPYPLYHSRYPAMYVIEAAAGFTRKHALKTGQTVRF